MTFKLVKIACKTDLSLDMKDLSKIIRRFLYQKIYTDPHHSKLLCLKSAPITTFYRTQPEVGQKFFFSLRPML